MSTSVPTSEPTIVRALYNNDPLIRGIGKVYNKDHNLSIRDLGARVQLYQILAQFEDSQILTWLKGLEDRQLVTLLETPEPTASLQTQLIALLQNPKFLALFQTPELAPLLRALRLAAGLETPEPAAFPQTPGLTELLRTPELALLLKTVEPPVFSQPPEPTLSKIPGVATLLEAARLAPPPPSDPPYAKPEKICIIGAGVSGLYAAMILEDLGIPYEILESDTRAGGRILTHRFTPAPYDYFDVGAMRFPGIPWMDRVSDLFNRIGVAPLLINYTLSNDNNHMHFNGHHMTAGAFNAAAVVDPFHFSVNNHGYVPNTYTAPPNTVDSWVGKVYNLFKANFDLVYNPLVPQELRPLIFRFAWAALTEHDHHSTRSYMNNIARYPESVIHWLETFDAGTGLYDQGFVESVLDSLDFDWPGAIVPGAPQVAYPWYCIDGGADHITSNMLAQITNPPLLNSRVTKIADNGQSIQVEFKDQKGNQTREYSHVICTAPLGCVATIDLTEARLLFGQKAGIRSLHYDASAKVGLKFPTRWWEDREFMQGNQLVEFTGGQSKSDLSIRVCVYPSYGINAPPENPSPGVMIASYTWAQDAQRIGSLCQNSDPGADALLLEQVLKDIAKLHNIPLNNLPPCIDHYAYSWHQNPHARGAFALFGPGQFGDWPVAPSPQVASIPPSSMFASMKAPAARGKLHFAGEATSMHHAWVLGSLNSAWRAIYNALEGYPALRTKLVTKWAIPDEETEVGLGLLLAAARNELL